MRARVCNHNRTRLHTWRAVKASAEAARLLDAAVGADGRKQTVVDAEGCQELPQAHTSHTHAVLTVCYRKWCQTVVGGSNCGHR